MAALAPAGALAAQSQPLQSGRCVTSSSGRGPAAARPAPALKDCQRASVCPSSPAAAGAGRGRGQLAGARGPRRGLCRAGERDPGPEGAAAPAYEDVPLPPGSFGWPFLGETAVGMRDFAHFYRSRRQQHGPIFKTRLFGREAAVVAEPELVKRVWELERERLVAPAWPSTFTALVGESNLLNQQGPEHTRLRRVFGSVFTARHTRSYFARVLELQLGAVAEWGARGDAAASAAASGSGASGGAAGDRSGPDDGSKQGAAFALYPEIHKLMLQTIVRVVLGGESLPPQAVAELEAWYVDWSAGLFHLLPKWVPFTSGARAHAARRRIVGFLQAIIDRRRAAAAAGAAGAAAAAAGAAGASAGADRDVLDNLLAARDDDGRPLDDEVITSNVLGLLFAGHHTSAAGATSLLNLVAQSPDTQAAVRAEVASWPPAERAPGGPVDYDRLVTSSVLEHVVMESLRVAPPALGAFRRAEADLTLGGFRVPKNWIVRPLWDAVHHSPDIYAQPEAFCPMRFVAPEAFAAMAGAGCGAAAAASSDSPAGRGEPFPTPFSGGSHQCLGIDLAKSELKLLLVLMHRDASYALADPRDTPAADRSLQMYSTRGMLPRDELLAHVGPPA